MDDLQQGQPVGNNPSDPGATEPAAAGTTPETTTGIAEPQSGQASETQAEGAPAEESFSDIDPKTLPPELQAIHRKMQAGFTKKMQGLSEAQKKAEFYDQMAQDEDLRNYLAQREQKGKQQADPEPLVSEEDYAEALGSPQGFAAVMQKVIQRTISPLQEKVRVAEAADILEEFASQGHDDLYKLQEDELISIQLRLDPPKNDQEYRSKVAEAYDRAKALTEKYFQQGYEKAKAEMSGVIKTKVNASSEPPTVNPGKTYEGPDPKTLSGVDAYRLAKRGVRVPQS